MAFVDGQQYTGKDGKVGTWNSQTGCFHVVDGEVSTKYTAEAFEVAEQDEVESDLS